MLKKTITYTDYFGEERTEDFFFNLSASELVEMETSVTGGFSSMIKGIVNAKDNPTIMKMFKQIILSAYGEKSEDGRRFVKSQEISKAFSETPAYTKLFLELVANETKASEFINSIMPSDEEMKKYADLKGDQNLAAPAA